MPSDSSLLALTSIAVFGFTGSLHCLGMCGPLAAASCRGAADQKALSKLGLVSYALARLSAYGILGFAAGLVGAVVLRRGLSLQTQTLAFVFAGLMLLWATFDFLNGVLAIRAGKAPTPLAHKLKAKNSSRLLPWILALPIPSSLALGAATAVLPCGFLAAAYVQAAVLAHPLLSASAMMIFAATTTPALLGGAFAHMGVQKLWPRYAPLVGSALLALASILLILRASSGPHDGHHHHHPSTETQ